MNSTFLVDPVIEKKLALTFADEGPATLYESFCRRCGRTILLNDPPGADAVTRAEAESKYCWYQQHLNYEPHCRECLHRNTPPLEIAPESVALTVKVTTNAPQSASVAVEVNTNVNAEVKPSIKEEVICVIDDQNNTVQLSVEVFDHDAMWTFSAVDDPNALLGVGGGRWLCRGGSVLEASTSGAGKSVARFQRAGLYALGLPAFGITPSDGRKIRSLILQPENDFGDESEIYQGVIQGISRQHGIPLEEVRNAIRERVIVARLDAAGEMFAQALDKLLAKYKPDLVWIDPIFSFWGRALTDMGEFTEFTRNRVQPILTRHKCAACLTHHLEKTGNKYFGPSDLLNWVRADVQISRCVSDPDVFCFSYNKRGQRSGVPNRKAYAKHDPQMLWWNEVPEPAGESAAQPTAKLPRYAQSSTKQPEPEPLDDMTRAFRHIEFEHEYSASEIIEKLMTEFVCKQRKAEKLWASMREHANAKNNLQMSQVAQGRYKFTDTTPF